MTFLKLPLTNSLTRGKLLSLFCLTLLQFNSSAQQNVAIIYAYPEDAKPETLFSEAELKQQMEVAKKYWIEQSYGRYTPNVDVFLFKMNGIKYEDSKAPVAKSSVIEMLSAKLPNGGDIVIPSYNPSKYDLQLFLYGGTNGATTGYSGGFTRATIKVNGRPYSVEQASLGYPNKSWNYYSPNRPFQFISPGRKFTGRMNGERAYYPQFEMPGGFYALFHEWMHYNNGSHSQYWRSQQEPMYGGIYWDDKTPNYSDQARDYGNGFSELGPSLPYSLHMNACYKDIFGWIAADEKMTLSGPKKDITLTPLEKQDHGILKTVQLTIPRGGLNRPAPFKTTAEFAFYIEYRRPMGYDIHLGHDYLKSNTEGIMVTINRIKNGYLESFLLDMSPDNYVVDKSPSFIEGPEYNNDDHHAVTLNRGRTFYDKETGYSLTKIRPSGDEGITFDVGMGNKPGVNEGVYVSSLYTNQYLHPKTKLPDAVGDSTKVLYSPELTHYMTVESGELVVRNSASKAIVKLEQAELRRKDITHVSFINGNMAFYKGSSLLWCTKTSGNPGARLVLGEGGQLQILSTINEVIWPEEPVLYGHYQGGLIYYIFKEGDPGYVASEVHGLIVTEHDWSGPQEWGCMGIDISSLPNIAASPTQLEIYAATGAGIGAGENNTELIMKEACSKVAKDKLHSLITPFGHLEHINKAESDYDDWFVPSLVQARKIWLAFHTTGGIADHLKVFEDKYHLIQGEYETLWTSNEMDKDRVYTVSMVTGNLHSEKKSKSERVRYVRQF